MKKKMKKKSKFPDHSGDGEITKKDILMAKGIIPKKKKTKKQLRASADDSYGKFGSKAKKSGKINR